VKADKILLYFIMMQYVLANTKPKNLKVPNRISIPEISTRNTIRANLVHPVNSVLTEIISTKTKSCGCGK
jgi:hypothetical protein